MNDKTNGSNRDIYKDDYLLYLISFVALLQSEDSDNNQSIKSILELLNNQS